MKNYIYLMLTITIFSFLSCSSNTLTLEKTNWKLLTLNNQTISKPVSKSREAYIIFDSEKISANSSCNNMRGSYVLDGNKISLSPNGMMMTMMFCEGSVENEFLSVLKEMYTYKIMTHYLFLYNKQGEEIAKFKPQQL